MKRLALFTITNEGNKKTTHNYITGATKIEIKPQVKPVETEIEIPGFILQWQKDKARKRGVV